MRLKGDSIEAINISFGGMAAIPKRATITENLLKRKTWDEDTLIVAMETLKQDFSPLSDMRASAAYRQQAASNLLHRFYLETRPQGALQSEAVNVFAVQA
jgi:xanthine dehydrogenase small subunit